MGFLLKIILFGVAVYAAWKTLSRWKGLYDRFVGTPPQGSQQQPSSRPTNPSAPQGAPQGPHPSTRPAPAAISDASACVRCGTYVAAGATKCERPDCPQPA